MKVQADVHADNYSFIQAAMKEIKSKFSVDDIITRLISMLDALEKARNTIFEPLFDLYFLYFPEAASLIKERDIFVDKAVHSTKRETLANALGISTETMGYDLDDTTMGLIDTILGDMIKLRATRQEIMSKLEDIIKTNYPNLFAVCGSELTSRLIALSGGVVRLSELPASKIQVLGAEKGLFSGSKKTPKHGVIFLHPYVEGADSVSRGKVAKIVASLISLAARTDEFSKKDRSAELVELMNEKIKKVKSNGTKKGNR